MSTKKDSFDHLSDEAFLQKLAGGPLSIGMILSGRRLSEDKTLVQYAKILGISKAHLCDIEKGRRLVSPARAARFAKKIGGLPRVYIQIALEDMLRKEGLKYHVELKEAS